MRFALIAALMSCTVFAGQRGSAQTTEGSAHVRARPASRPAVEHFPNVILWAWQRPGNLTYINPRKVGVSYLVETVHLAPSGLTVEPNLNSLEVPAGTWVMACARIESGGNPSLILREPQVSELADQLARLAQFPNAKAVQIDFDATVSQRDFYRHLLVELRRRLSASVPLSMTALASWCEGDDWISRLPVDEAVPMLFRMGPDSGSILFHLDAGGDFADPVCRESAGISTDEFVPRLPSGRRLYIFDPSGWTRASFEKIMAKVSQ